MRVTFVLPVVPPLAGGIKVVFRYSNELARRGHTVSIVFPAQMATLPPDEWLGLKSRLRMVKHAFLRWRQGHPVEWFDLDPQVRFLELPNLQDHYLPEADILIATSWHTARWVNAASLRRGLKFYFIQHYEAVMGPNAEVDATWKMPLRKIVIASWLKELSEQKFGEPIYDLVVNGVDLAEFYNEHKIYHSPQRIGMMYHTAEWKGIPDGIRAFELARAKHPDIRLVMFGVYPPEIPLADYMKFHLKPYGESLRQLYCSFNIFLSPSWTEGNQAPPMEAMACQCAVVATNVGGIPDYTLPGETALVSPPKEPERLAENLVTLLDDPAKLERISQAGYHKIREFSWENATRKIIAAFERALRE